MAYRIEITRHAVSYRTREGVTPTGGRYGGEWMDGDHRTLAPPVTDTETYDADDHAWWDGDVIDWAVDRIGRTDVMEPSAWPIGDTAPEPAWLSGQYTDPYEGDDRVTETSVRLTGDWTPQQRAAVFRAVCRA